MAKFKANNKSLQFTIVGLQNKETGKLVLTGTNLPMPSEVFTPGKNYDVQLDITEQLGQAVYLSQLHSVWAPFVWAVRMLVGVPASISVREYRFKKGLKKGRKIPPSAVYKGGFPNHYNAEFELVELDASAIEPKLKAWGVDSLPRENTTAISADKDLEQKLL